MTSASSTKTSFVLTHTPDQPNQSQPVWARSGQVVRLERDADVPIAILIPLG
jgi:hypothetical protein